MHAIQQDDSGQSQWTNCITYFENWRSLSGSDSVTPSMQGTNTSHSNSKGEGMNLDCVSSIRCINEQLAVSTILSKYKTLNLPLQYYANPSYLVLCPLAQDGKQFIPIWLVSNNCVFFVSQEKVWDTSLWSGCLRKNFFGIWYNVIANSRTKCQDG